MRIAVYRPGHARSSGPWRCCNSPRHHWRWYVDHHNQELLMLAGLHGVLHNPVLGPPCVCHAPPACLMHM